MNEEDVEAADEFADNSFHDSEEDEADNMTTLKTTPTILSPPELTTTRKENKKRNSVNTSDDAVKDPKRIPTHKFVIPSKSSA
jgi:hypothetical protein